jgi:hypothetical protein
MGVAFVVTNRERLIDRLSLREFMDRSSPAQAAFFLTGRVRFAELGTLAEALSAALLAAQRFLVASAILFRPSGLMCLLRRAVLGFPA